MSNGRSRKRPPEPQSEFELLPPLKKRLTTSPHPPISTSVSSQSLLKQDQRHFSSNSPAPESKTATSNTQSKSSQSKDKEQLARILAAIQRGKNPDVVPRPVPQSPNEAKKSNEATWTSSQFTDKRPLPRHLLELEEEFFAIESFMGAFGSRREIDFARLKKAVELATSREFDEIQLKRILTLDPTLYQFSWQKRINASTETAELTLIVSNPKFSFQISAQRKIHFHSILLKYVENFNNSFESTSSEKLSNLASWKSGFDLESVPKVVPTEFEPFLVNFNAASPPSSQDNLPSIDDKILGLARTPTKSKSTEFSNGNSRIFMDAVRIWSLFNLKKSKIMEEVTLIQDLCYGTINNKVTEAMQTETVRTSLQGLLDVTPPWICREISPTGTNYIKLLVDSKEFGELRNRLKG